MFCRMCGKPVHEQAVVCPACGCAPRNPSGTICWNCGQTINPQAIACPKCSATLTAPPTFTMPSFGTGAKSRQTAGILQIVGFFCIGGIGRFYLGDNQTAIFQLVLSICGIGQIWSLIDGIMILTGSVNTDAQGNPLSP